MRGESSVTGLDQFLEIFGNITVSHVVVFIFALLFCWKAYSQFVKFLENKKELAIQKYECEKEKDKQLKTALEEVAKYPQYREQSRRIQEEFRKEIDGLKQAQTVLADTQQEIYDSLKDMQKKQDRRERNKLRDKLLQSYRYYTDINRNPSQSWTEMESEAFWELFRDYEDAGGDGFIHTVVQPAMNLLKIVDNL